MRHRALLLPLLLLAGALLAMRLSGGGRESKLVQKGPPVEYFAHGHQARPVTQQQLGDYDVEHAAMGQP